MGDQGTFGQGVNVINLYLLGSNRTLTLANGRRVVSSNVPGVLGNAAPGTQVDLHVIPAILVDRVERVSIGGAPVCGSDAIAGTVNVVLKRKFEGLETRATSGISADGDHHPEPRDRRRVPVWRRPRQHYHAADCRHRYGPVTERRQPRPAQRAS
jgi:outer membrane receptor for ferrienterochelin and colicin